MKNKFVGFACSLIAMVAPIPALATNYYYGYIVPPIDYDKRPNTVLEFLNESDGTVAYRHIIYCDGDEVYGGPNITAYSTSYVIDTCA